LKPREKYLWKQGNMEFQELYGCDETQNTYWVICNGNISREHLE
jgi:hypothetical protein